LRAEYIAQAKRAASQNRFKLMELGVGTERDFIWFNQNTGTNAAGKPLVIPAKLKWFRNKKFRQAVSCALDRERLAREAYDGSAHPIYGFLSTENPKWNNPNIAKFGYDPARARALLAEIGIQDRKGAGMLEDAEGNPIEIVFISNTGNPMREKAALMIQEDLKKIGIILTYVRVEFRTLLEKVNGTFDYECALMGLGGGGVDPASQLNVLRSSEELHQWFPFQKTPATEWEARIDALMEAQMRTLDFAQRKKAFDEVQAILGEELPMIYTVSPFAFAAIRSDIGNVRPSVLTPYRVTWNIEELYVRK
jgi:peptide/nickel transport system substrate-binding protein